MENNETANYFDKPKVIRFYIPASRCFSDEREKKKKKTHRHIFLFTKNNMLCEIAGIISNKDLAIIMTILMHIACKYTLYRQAIKNKETDNNILTAETHFGEIAPACPA